MSDEATRPKPSPEVEQLTMLGQVEDAVRLYAKQAEVDEATARTDVGVFVDRLHQARLLA